MLSPYVDTHILEPRFGLPTSVLPENESKLNEDCLNSR